MTIMKTLHTIYTNFAKQNLASLRLLLVMFLTLTITANAWGEDVKYTVSSTSAVTVSGTAPAGSSATYSSTYNEKFQLTGSNSMTLTLSGYDGCTITGLTLSMKSNTKGGAGNMSMKIGSTTATSISTAKFNTNSWYGSWSTSYVNVTPSVTAAIVGNGEKIVIKIAATENSIYCQSFTLTYEPSSSGGDTGDACGWVETELDDVQSSDVIVITMTNSNGTTCAMSNNNGTSSAPAAVEVGVDGTSLTSEITDNIKWNVGGNNDSYTFYPNGDTSKWLYATSTNNGVRVGTNTNKTFKIDATAGYLFHNGTSRYIGVYNSQDWRCYTTVHDNIKDQTLKFYKYVPCGPTETTISFDANGGAGGPSSVTATKNKPMPSVASSLPSRTGYTFKGFYDAQLGGTKYYNADGTSAKEWDKDYAEYTLYAQWTANKHSLTWNLNGGTVTTAGTNAAVNSTGTASGSVAYGTAIKAPVVIKTGYTFAGWHDGNSIVTPPNTMPDNNISYKAQWTPNTYTVQFDANEGIGEMENQSFTYDAEPTSLSANIFERVGYNFNGWNTAKDGTGEPYNDKAEVQNLTVAANGVVTLYAQWTAKNLINFRTLCTYDIIYEETYGVDHDNSDTYTAASLPLTFTAPTSAREGYTFAGWNPASLDETTRGDQTITAQWQVNSHTLTWNVNGGDELTGEYTTGSVEYGTTIIPPANPTRTGYTFAGWGAEVAQTMPDHDLVYTAQWTVNTYIITLDQQGGIGGSESIEVTYDAELPAITVPTREGYTFGGYFTFENGVGAQYYNQNGTAYYSKKWDIASATTLYAKWTPHKFTVKFNANGGDGSMEDQQFTYDIEQALSANQFTRVGYSFAGWNDKTDGSGTSYTDQQVVKNLTATKDGQKTLYAQWASIHTITWLVNGSQAEGEPTTSVVNGQTITTLPTTPDVDCNGKVFVGWTTAEIVGETATVPDPLYTELGAFPVVTSNMTFYAVFANGSGDERWIETEIEEIEPEDEILVTMKLSNGDTYTLDHSKGTTALPPAQIIGINGNEATFSSLYHNNSIWNISGNATDGYILYPNGSETTWLYCTKSNKNVKVGTTKNNVFAIDNGYLKHTNTTESWIAYLGVYISGASTIWHHENLPTATSITGQTLKFYKKTTVYTSYTNYSTSCIEGVCDITNANPIYVTSAVGQKIKATDKLVLTTTDMAIGTEISLSAPNITFYKEGVESTQLTTTTASETFELEIAYQPTIANTTEQPTITLEILGYKFTIDNKITGRSLPETFAIVAKVGNVWYALPSQGLNSETTPVGYPVEVDNNDNPTAVTAVPDNADWSLRQVYASSGSNDRFTANGENLVFVNAENKTLYANNGNANIQTYAEYTNYAATNPDRYEWIPSTTDLTTYTLKNVGRDKDLSINVNATFGTHASNIASNNLRFLPINATYNPFDMQVVEWYPTKVLVQTEAVLTSVSAIVGGEAVANPVVTKKGGKLYEISGLPLESNPTKILTISYDTYSCSKVIPIIISREEKTVTDAPFSTLTTSAYNYSDLVVRDGATLTINGTKQAPDKFVNVTIYPTAKIVVPENKQLSVYSLTFFGGIDDIYDGEKYTTNKYGVPQLSLKGTLGKTVTTMDYIMRVNTDQMYSLGLPYDVALADIKYWDGSAIGLGTQLYVSAYDGQARANREKKTWIYETDFETKLGSATLKAGVGYTISAEPQVDGDTYSILRMPMKNNINSGATEGEKKVNVVAYDNQKGVTITDNHKGWNLLSNPYMTAISGGEADTKLVLGYLKETGTGPWEWVETTQRYVTIPMDNGKDYYQKKFSEAELKPFKSFFVQIATDGELSFALASRQNSPARHLQQATTSREVEFEVLLSNGKQSDNTGLLIYEEFTPAYEINADLEKMMGSMSIYTIYNGYTLAYNALSPLNAEEQIPVGYIVPAKGEYTFSLDERGNFEELEHIYLMDKEMGVTIDLLEEEYVFNATEMKSDTRFAINVVLKSEGANAPTGLDDSNVNGEQTCKFFYQDKLYIKHNGVIYDATGKHVK